MRRGLFLLCTTILFIGIAGCGSTSAENVIQTEEKSSVDTETEENSLSEVDIIAQMAEKLSDDGDYEKAIEEYEKVILMEPENSIWKEKRDATLKVLLMLAPT